MHPVALIALFLFGALALPSPSPGTSPGSGIAEFAVKYPLPYVTFSVPESWAGSIPIGPAFGNDSLFFWLWDAETNAADEHLIIWLNGGPGCSSMLGIFKEHGPILFPGNASSPQPNPFSWTRLANVLYVDQPVGTGFSNGNHRATNNVDDTDAFVHWLVAFFKRFPALKSKKIHLLGESYAGIFIPYIVNRLRQEEGNIGIKITSIGMGDSTWANAAALLDVGTTTFVKDHITSYGTKMPKDVLAVLEKADTDCGFSSVLSHLTYPPASKIVIPGNPENNNYRRGTPPAGYDPSICDFTTGTQTPTQLAFIINGTSLADGCYGNCATFDAALNYFLDAKDRCFNVYNIDVDCSNPLYSDDAFTLYLNLPNVQSAIHAPAGLPYLQCNATLQAQLTTHAQRSVPPAYFILPSLLEAGVKVNLWSGTSDYILNFIGAELAIQNMTWNGAQGFRHAPSTEWYDDQHNYAGLYEIERGLGYYRFDGAGHRTAQDKPGAAFSLVQHRVVENKALPWA